MVQWVKCWAGKAGFRSPSLVRPGPEVCVYNTNAVGGGHKWILGVCWPASLVERVSSKFSETSHPPPKKNWRASKTAQSVNVLVTKPQDLGSISGTQKVGENLLLKVVFWLPRAHCGMRVPHPSINVIGFFSFLIYLVIIVFKDGGQRRETPTLLSGLPARTQASGLTSRTLIHLYFLKSGSFFKS